MKANASELRIGNYIQDKKGQTITILKVAHLSEGLINYWMESVYQTIPLNEEWLLKFGFKPHNGAFYKIPVGGSELFINPDNGVVWIERNENIFNNPALIECVHQLQNLYFALTGKELEIK